jgi:uncharacterized protein (DUF362 family)/ferredoxin
MNKRTSAIPLSLTTCASYAMPEVRAALTQLLQPLGGLSAFVKPGMNVFLKPNLLSSRDPRECVTTHPALVEAVAEACRALGARVLIGDSPPISFGKLESYWKTTGMRTAADRTGAELISLEKEPRREVTVAGPAGPVRIHVTEWYFKADCIINLPKLKTHNLTVITGAVKNHYGLLPGAQKAQFHLRIPQPHLFSAFFAEIYRTLPTHLSIMDGVEGMDETGPAGGRIIKPGVLLASPSAVAVDLGFLQLAGLGQSDVPYLAYCRAHGIGPASFSDLAYHGPSLAQVRIAGFRAPPSRWIWRVIPPVLVRLLKKVVWLRPAIEAHKCVKCGLCVKVCPAEAIKTGAKAMVIRRRPCIGCFCCTEVCPVKAIAPVSSPLVTLALTGRRFKYWLLGRKADY